MSSARLVQRFYRSASYIIILQNIASHAVRFLIQARSANQHLSFCIALVTHDNMIYNFVWNDRGGRLVLCGNKEPQPVSAFSTTVSTRSNDAAQNFLKLPSKRSKSATGRLEHRRTPTRTVRSAVPPANYMILYEENISMYIKRHGYYVELTFKV